MRDPDGYIYFKKRSAGLLMGGFEPHANPWLQSGNTGGGIPENFGVPAAAGQPGTRSRFLLDNAMIRVPALENAQVKQFYNGPESFTADNNFIVGPARGSTTFMWAVASTRWASPLAAALASPRRMIMAESQRSICGRSTSGRFARFQRQRDLAA